MFVVWQILGVLKSILEHPFFAGITLLILAWAWVTEIRDVQKYQQANKVTGEAINYLIDQKSQRNSSEKTIAIVEKPDRTIWNWIENHIETELINGKYGLKIHDNSFIPLLSLSGE